MKHLFENWRKFIEEEQRIFDDLQLLDEEPEDEEKKEIDEADWQAHVRATYDDELKRVLRGGGNKTKAKPFGKKARIDYRGSAPPGAGGS